jgi:hypothetical protein
MAQAQKIMVAGLTPDRPHRIVRSTPELGWELLGWVGMAFALIGALDLALAWLPPAFGNAQWEFGTVSVSLNGLPLPALGLMLVLTAGVAQGSRWKVRLALAALLLLTVVLLASAVLYVTVVPLALQDVQNPAVRTGLMKSIVKALLLLALYPTLFVWAAVKGWRASRPLSA